MNAKEFDNWKKRFKRDIERYTDKCKKLQDLHNLVMNINWDVIDTIEGVQNGWRNLLGYKSAWYGIDKMRTEIKYAKKKFDFLHNVLEVSRPLDVSFLTNYKPAYDCCNKIKNNIIRFGRQLGVDDFVSFSKYACMQSYNQILRDDWEDWEVAYFDNSVFYCLFEDLNVLFWNRYERCLEVYPLHDAICRCFMETVPSGYSFEFSTAFWDDYEKDKTKLRFKMRYD